MPETPRPAVRLWMFVVCLVVVVATKFPALRLPAFDPDNLVALSMGEKSFAGLFGHVFAFLPYYRPVEELSVWLEFALHGFEHIAWYFAANLVILAVAAFVFALVVLRVTSSVAGSVVAAAVLIVHPGAFYLVSIIGERSNALVLVFGFLAILAWLALERLGGRSPALVVALVACLFLASLAKEVGLAFSLAVFLASVAAARGGRRRSMGWVALAIVGVVVARVALHAAVIGIRPVGAYGECHAFLTECWEASYVDLGPWRTTGTLLYTIGANLVAALAPYVFAGKGALSAAYVTPAHVLFMVLNSTLVLIGFFAAPRRERLLFGGLCLGQALASMTIFRVRNHLVSDAGAIALAYLGLRAAWAWVDARWPGAIERAVRVACVAAVLALVASRGAGSVGDLRRAVLREREIDPATMRQGAAEGISPAAVRVQHRRFVERHR